jgi:hypothetical protein
LCLASRGEVDAGDRIALGVHCGWLLGGL